MMKDLYQKAIDRAVGWCNDNRGEIHLYYALQLGLLLGIPERETVETIKHEINTIKENMVNSSIPPEQK